ncbi:hypothetical protein HZB03_01300 [Candidatus Woesearchaeota archaeon]|nr:hypothetical protein [Candidatus Woesearchaeota archaeon]
MKKLNNQEKKSSAALGNHAAEQEWANYILSLRQDIEEVKRRVADMLDLPVIDIPIKITFVPGQKNIADYVCKVNGDSIECDLMRLFLDIYDIEESLKFVANRKDLVLYIIAHEYTHFMLFVKEPTLFRFRPGLMTSEKEKRADLYRMGYSTYELFADYVANRLFPEVHKKVLARMNLDEIGQPYKNHCKEFLKMKKGEFLKALKHWTLIVPDSRIIDAVKKYHIKVRIGKKTLVCEV